MAWSKFVIFLVALFVATGSLNTLTTKWADKIEAPSSDGIVRVFAHPFSQALVMFIGEASCLLVFKVLVYIFRKRGDGSVDTNALTAGNRDFSIWIFFIPAMADMVATSVMYVGLNLTYASSFQMLRGSVIAFTAALSIILLRAKVKKLEWLGIVVIILGLVIVGLSDFLGGDDESSEDSTSNVIIGDILIIVAQVLTALQMVAEQYFVNGHNVAPLQAVGWEGIFGFTVLGLLHIPMYWIYVPAPFANNPRMVLEDLPDALQQIGNEPLLLAPLIGTVISIAFFNYAGIAVTKELSAATRTVLDSVRTLFIWVITLALGWQVFSPIQIAGFIVLVLGMCVYNDIYVNDWVAAAYYKITGKQRPPKEAPTGITDAPPTDNENAA